MSQFRLHRSRLCRPRFHSGLFLLLAGCSLSTPLLAQQTKKADTAPSVKAAPSVEAQKDEEILVRAERRDRMEVTSGGQLGALGTKKGLDVPFNIRSYNSSLILNQQSQTLGQVLQNDPSVRTTYGYGNFSELFIIRGFPVYSDDVAIDGLYGIVPRQLVSPQLYDQVQVLNGASAFLNGSAPGGTAIGGNINLIFKKAGNTPLTRVTGDYTSTGQGGGAVDFGRRFGRDKAFGVRINVAGMSGQTSVDHETRHSAVVGGAFDWHNDTTRVVVDMNYQNQGVDWGRPAIFLGSGLRRVPRPPAPSRNFGQPWTYVDLNYIFGKLSIEHDFSSNVLGYVDFGGLGSNEKGMYSTLTVNDVATGAATNANLYVPYGQTNESTRGGLRIHVRTGPVKHEINLGGTSVWETTRTAYSFGFPYYASNLYAPTYYRSAPPQTFASAYVNDPKRQAYVRMYSLFFSDTMSFFDDRVALTAGFRYQNLTVNGYSYNTAARTTHYSQGVITPVVGLVVHPTRRTSIYFNRIEGLSQGPQASGAVVNVGQIFPPYRTLQYEIGAKYDIGTLSASIALYQMSQPNAMNVADGSSGQQIFTVNGLQKNRGIEFNLNGQIVPGLRFNGGTAIIDADQKRTAGGAYNGNRAIGIPGYTINGNLEYDLPFLKGATVVGRVIQTGHQWANAANTLRVPNWTRWDLAARYTFLAGHKPMTVRFGVNNLANSRYWASAYGGYLMEGLPRTFQFSLTTEF
ncbi:TonB-dependent receptor [Acidomonas methanolica]|uniref:TonB-dependent receptor n=1 Tax=Acidomonas methanolica TaxID=437 RepID=UPI00351CCCF1|nr:TonB-dependent siderophore receptor [Acidomonas methanolica]